jgi:hypothetical protein
MSIRPESIGADRVAESKAPFGTSTKVSRPMNL